MIEVDHLLFGILEDRNSVIMKALELIGANAGELIDEIVSNLTRGDTKDQNIEFSENVLSIFNSAYDLVRKFGLKFIYPSHLLMAILTLKDSSSVEILNKYGVSIEKWRILIQLSNPELGLPDSPE